MLNVSLDEDTRILLRSLEAMCTPNTSVLRDPVKHYTLYLTKLAKFSTPSFIGNEICLQCSSCQVEKKRD